MARISELREGRIERLSLHEAVESEFYPFELDGRKLLQINTFGRSTRENPGKISQSIQLDEASATALFTVLKNHFGLR